MPKFAEGGVFQVSQPMLCVLVETAGYYNPIPGNDTRMPEFPAMRQEPVFQLPFS